MPKEYKLIGVCLSTIQHEDRFNFIKALNACAVEHGYRLLIFNSCSDLFVPDNVNDMGEKAVFDLIPYDQLTAMVILPYFIYDEKLMENIVERCRKAQLPVFSVDKYMEGCINYAFTYSDSFERLTGHVIEEHGAKSVFMMAGVKGNRFSEERVEAFRTAVESHGIQFSDELVGYGDFWEEPTENTLKRWFLEERREVPDAIVCANDTMAITTSNFLQQRLGLKLPRDCIVTGFDGIREADYHIPKLTTCRQDYGRMGRLIMENLEDLLAGREYSKEEKVEFEIIRSQSCGCQPLQVDNVNETVKSLNVRMALSAKRQEMMCGIQTAISNMSGLDQLRGILDEWFLFHSMTFAVNSESFSGEQDYEKLPDGKPFSDTMNVLYHNYFWEHEEPCTIPAQKLAPCFERYMKREDPIVLSAIHFLDLPLGYCVFQPAIEVDEYEKLHTFMITIDSSLGIYHSQLRIKAINEKLVKVNDELERLYVHDYLTGLLNRRGFYRQFSKQVLENADKDAVVFFISADLDGLKTINDTYGHIEGDNAITAVGRALMAGAVHGEICARFGGDEFTVACVIPKDTAEDYFEKYCLSFNGYLDSYNNESGKPYNVEASIGCYSQPLTEDFELDEMIKHSDNSMYANKLARKKARR